MANNWFFDIESYRNYFCVFLLNDQDELEGHYLLANGKQFQTHVAEIERACQDSGFVYQLYDLEKDATRLVKHFKRHIPSMGKDSLLAQFLGLDEEEVKPKEDNYYSYNGLHYDIQMIAYLEKAIIANRARTTPEKLRLFSDALIDNTAYRINTLPYEQYANQIDGGYLNESMIDKGRIMIGLKTLVGMLGGSIIESESNKTGYSKDIYGDTLYCINDVKEFRDVVYKGTKLEITHNVRKELLEMFGDRLHRNGVTVNSTSAKFVENIIAPDKPIVDYPTCHFMYPAPHIAKEHGIEPFDILEYTKEWYMKNVYAQVVKHNPEVANGHYMKFMSIYQFYASFRGKNWNTSSNHYLMYNIPAQEKYERRELLETYGTYLPLIDRYGNHSYTHVNFSSGGIHGAEEYKAQLLQDRAKIKELKEKYKYLSLIPKSEVSRKLYHLMERQSRSNYGGYPQHLMHEIPYFYYKTEPVDEICNPEDFTPYCYDPKSGSERLIDRYKYTSTGDCLHQDFEGYYPKLLINMGVFYDGHGTDIYHEIYKHRSAIKAKLKTLEFMSEEYLTTNIKQEGFKLVQNSASGVLDGGFDTKVRANNKAISMRIIGQLITWIIAQALALEGARVPSSNTDGIYVFDIDRELNEKIVERELEKLFVTIEPEPCFLISKDTNNRAEIEDGQVKSARGGTLTSHGGPVVDKRLSHPAVVDAVLVRYLQNEDVVNKPIDKKLIHKALQEYRQSVDRLTFIKMTAWVMRPSSGSIFIDGNDQVYPGTIRTWLTKEGTTLKRYATAKRKPSLNYDEMIETLPETSPVGKPEVIVRLGSLDALKYFPQAISVKEYEDLDDFRKPNKERQSPSVPILGEQKISNLPEDAHIYMDNTSILTKSEEELAQIEQMLDLDAYVAIVAQFAENWCNHLQPS